MFFIFQVSRKIFAEVESNSDTSADSHLTTYTHFQVCGKLSFGKQYFSYLSQDVDLLFSSDLLLVPFRIDYCRLLMVLLPLLLALLHVVSFCSQVTVPYWWWDRNGCSSCSSTSLPAVALLIFHECVVYF
jgi:hypothetical protein